MLGDRIKACRKQKKISQMDLADMLNVSQAAITSWERGVRKPDVDTVAKMADIFCVTTDYLIGRDQEATTIPLPDDMAAHTESDMSPELKAEIEEIARRVYEKYAKKE